MHKENSNIYNICMISIFTAVISIMAQFSIPLPFGVPISLQNFAVTLTAILLGRKNGTIAVLIYLLIGMIGIPVFTNFRSGLQTFVSPTGGFLISYPIMTYLIGFGVKKRQNNSYLPLFMMLGYLINYICGVLVFCLVTTTNIKTGLAACVLPFLPADIIKSILAGILGLKLRKKILPYWENP